MAAKKNTSSYGRVSSPRGVSGQPSRKNTRNNFINGYALTIAPSGRVCVAFKKGKMYIPHVRVRKQNVEFWATCFENYTPDEIRELIRKKAFRWVDFDKYQSKYGSDISNGIKPIWWL